MIPRPRPVVALLPIALAALVACSASPPIGSPSAAPASVPIASAPIASAPAASASTTPLASAPAPSASAPPATATPIAAGWRQTWPGSGDPHRVLAAILALDGGFVVTGVDRATMAAAAMSGDGVSWMDERITGANIYPSTLAAWGNRVVAVGAGEVNCAHPFGLDTWLRSADGVWAEAPFDDLFCRGSDVQIGFVDGRPILVGSGPGDSPAAWSSADGLHWVDRGGAVAGVLPRAVAGDGDSAVLFAESSAGLWVSTTANGTSWTAPAMIPGLPTDLVIHGAFWIDGAPSLIVSEGDIVGSIRPDGNGGWRRARAEGLTAGALRSVTSFGDGLLAVTGDSHVQAWVSHEGVSWRRIDLPQDLAAAYANVAGVAVRDGRAVLVGSVNDSSDNQMSAIWTGPASLVEP